jgi:hypothetical protein
MENVNTFIEDAILLCESILDTTDPSYDWGVVNLVRSADIYRKERIFTSLTYPQIPASYYYSFFEIPKFLSKKGVFVSSCYEWCWFVGKGYYLANSNDPEIVDRDQVIDDLTFEASRRGWINKGFKKNLWLDSSWNIPDEIIEVIVKYTKSVQFEDPYNEGKIKYEKRADGPQDRYNEVMLFDRTKMEQFLLQQKQLSPVFIDSSNQVAFLGETITFTGEQTKMVKILIENINSIVSWENLFNNSGRDYQAELKSHDGKVGKLHESLINIYKEVRKKFYQNKTLDSSLAFVQHNGFGIFIDSHSIRNL